MNTAVLLVIFNRPDTAHRVFASIREARPPRLYIAADGPRPHKEGEAELCRQTREVVNLVDWPCEVKTLFRDTNVGCRDGVSHAIDWMFETEEEGIIMEDDCLAGESFFPFCEAMLERYRHDERIMHISGNNFQHGIKRGTGTYYFAKYNHAWGWATWKRAWKLFDVTMSKLPAVVASGEFRQLFKTQAENDFWQDIFERVHRGEIPTAWDYQWTFSLWINSGLAVLPNVNLVSNIGFTGTATHTSEVNNDLADLPVYPLTEYIAPLTFIPDREADYDTFRRVYHTPYYKRVLGKLARVVKGKK